MYFFSGSRIFFNLYDWLRWRFFFLLKISDKSEPLDEEKEAFDDAEKGKLAGETEKATKTPDKKPITEQTETKPETDAENKEEKKSNGAHTPVWIFSWKKNISVR